MPPIAPSSPRRRTSCLERSRNSLRSARKNGAFSPFAHANGLVAQLEERLNGIEEVVSSNLIGSTNLFIINKLCNICRQFLLDPTGSKKPEISAGWQREVTGLVRLQTKRSALTAKRSLSTFTCVVV